jgi:hypothetical protein
MADDSAIVAVLSQSGRLPIPSPVSDEVMVAPGFLENPEVRRWLDGVEPAWTMLNFDTSMIFHRDCRPAISRLAGYSLRAELRKLLGSIMTGNGTLQIQCRNEDVCPRAVFDPGEHSSFDLAARFPQAIAVGTKDFRWKIPPVSEILK